MSETKLTTSSINCKGYGTVPKLVMQDKDLDVVAKAFYAYLCSYTGIGDTAYPSIDKITSDLGISRQRLERHRKSLIEKGYITITKERNEGKFDRNVYKLNQEIGLSPQLQNPTSVFTSMENVTTNNNSINNNNINNKKQSVVKTTDREKKEYDVESDEYKLVDLFVKLMEKQNELFKGPKNYNTWCDSMRKILDLDLTNLSKDRNERCKIAQQIIVHSCNKHFFNKNIMSIDKLRKRLKEVWADCKVTNNNGYKNNYQPQQPATPTYKVSTFDGLTLD